MFQNWPKVRLPVIEVVMQNVCLGLVAERSYYYLQAADFEQQWQK